MSELPSDREIRASIRQSVWASFRDVHPSLRHSGNTAYWHDGDILIGIRLSMEKHHAELTRKVSPIFTFEDPRLTEVLCEILEKKFAPMQFSTYEEYLGTIAARNSMRVVKQAFSPGTWLFSYHLKDDDFFQKSEDICFSFHQCIDLFKRDYVDSRVGWEETHSISGGKRHKLRFAIDAYLRGDISTLKTHLKKFELIELEDYQSAFRFFSKKLSQM